MSNPLYSHVVEIGAGDRYSSEALPLALNGQARKVTLYEPNWLLYADLAVAVEQAQMADVRAVEAAVASATWDRDALFHLGYASWMNGVPSFVATSVEPEGLPYLAPLMRMVAIVETSNVVTPDVDLLILTCNGCERVCLESLDQHGRRPVEIRTKHYIHNAVQGEVAGRVWRWMQDNRYHGTITEGNQHSTFLAVKWERAS